MKKILSNILTFVVLLFLLINLLLKSSNIQNSIQLAFDIWKNNLFPSLFPMFVLSEIFISLNLADYFSKFTHPFTRKLFNSHKLTGYILFMGILTGFPGSAKIIYQFYQQQKISMKEAEKLLLFTHFSNPLFIINTIAISFLQNKNLAILIFISHYLSNIIIGILLKKYHPSEKEITNTSFYNTRDNTSKNNFGVVLGQAILNSMNTLFLILGTISIFLCFTTILRSVLSLGEVENSILSGILEMSQGLNYIRFTDISLRLKTTLSVMFISFGGFSVHLQIMAILSNTSIKYLPFLLTRILHAIIASFLAYFLFPLF